MRNSPPGLKVPTRANQDLQQLARRQTLPAESSATKVTVDNLQRKLDTSLFVAFNFQSDAHFSGWTLCPNFWVNAAIPMQHMPCPFGTIFVHCVLFLRIPCARTANARNPCVNGDMNTCPTPVIFGIKCNRIKWIQDTTHSLLKFLFGFQLCINSCWYVLLQTLPKVSPKRESQETTGHLSVLAAPRTQQFVVLDPRGIEPRSDLGREGGGSLIMCWSEWRLDWRF